MSTHCESVTAISDHPARREAAGQGGHGNSGAGVYGAAAQIEAWNGGARIATNEGTSPTVIGGTIESPASTWEETVELQGTGNRFQRHLKLESRRR